MSKEIVLLNSALCAVVDDEDFDAVNQYAWKLDSKGYSARYVPVAEHRQAPKAGRHLHQRMHRLIFGIPHVDHKDGNRLNNQRYNLRAATQSENLANADKKSRRKGVAATSAFKGVCWNRWRSKWHAQIQVYGNKLHLGLFTDEKAAAAAYNCAAQKYFGEFARVNIL